MSNLRLNSKLLYETIFERHSDPLFLMDVHSKIIFDANQAAINLYGYSMDDFRKMRLRDLNFDVDKKEVDLKTSEMDLIHQSKDKQILHVRASLVSIHIDDHDYFLCVIIPYTKKHNLDFILDETFFNMPDASVIVDSKNHILEINPSFTLLFGYEKQECLGQNLTTLLNPNGQVLSRSDRFKDGFGLKTVEFEGMRSTKEKKNIYVNITVIPSNFEGDVIGAQIIYKNIDNLKNIESELKIFQKIIENHMDGVIVTNALHEIIWANQAFLDITGYNIDEIIGKLPSFMRSFRHNQAYYDAFEQKLKNDGSWQGEIWNKHKKGTIHPFWMQSFLIKDEIMNFTRFVAVYKDLEKAELFNQKILLMMQRDPLTFVYNRTFFVEKVEHIFQTFHMQAHTVVFLDLDNFKIYNDKNGHMLGDSLLSAFASRLLHFFNNETVARYGGDEFVILFKNQDDKLHISEMMDQLNKQLKEEPIVIRDAKYQLSVSYGISTYPKDGGNISVLIDNADKKMYLNKNKNV